jgi:predicted DCC family thiol-disulfide oxidoreductase YuxK
MQTLRRQLAATYFSFDTRSLALFRIALGCTLLLDLALRYEVLDAFYTNLGILPNHTLLWSPSHPYMFSLFFSASLHHEALLLMIGCGLAFLALSFGFHTKWAQALSLVAVISLDVRLAPLENGGDMVLSLLCIWSLFLPLGERLSIDSLRASLRRREQQSPGELNDRTPIRTPARRVYSLACFALLAQFFAIYALNAFHKSGPTWLSGDAVHYALHQDRIVKWPGVWLREHASVSVLHLLTYATIAAEAFGAIAIISPIATRYMRLLAILVMPAVHLGFEVFLDVGIFSFVMIAFYPLLLEPSHWEWLQRTATRWHRRRVVFVDEDCGFCMWCARLLARLDVLERLEFASNADTDRLPRSISLEQADESITTLEPDTGRVQRGAAAFAALFRSLPFGFLVAIPLELPGLRVVAERAYALVASHRLQISVWLGYTACGLPTALGSSAMLAPLPEEASAARELVRRSAVILREACVLLYILAAASEVVNTNNGFPAALRHAQPELFSMLVQYPRAFQVWRMFAPHAPLEDFMIEVDAITADNRHVDPYNEIASRVPGPGYTEIPARLSQNQFFCGYSLFAWMPHFRPYSTAFEEWIMRYSDRTGRPNDRIVRYTVYKLSDHSPPPGQTRATGFERQELLRWPR